MIGNCRRTLRRKDAPEAIPAVYPNRASLRVWTRPTFLPIRGSSAPTASPTNRAPAGPNLTGPNLTRLNLTGPNLTRLNGTIPRRVPQTDDGRDRQQWAARQ